MSGLGNDFGEAKPKIELAREILAKHPHKISTSILSHATDAHTSSSTILATPLIASSYRNHGPSLLLKDLQGPSST